MYNKNQFPVNWSTREILQSQIPEEENFLSFSPYDSDLRLDLKYNMNQSTMKDKINNGQWPSLQEINKFNETQNRILYEKEKMKKKTTPQTEEEDSWLDTLQDAGTSFLQGTTFGLQDEFNGIMGALGYAIADVLTGRMPTKETLVSGYVKARDEERERYEKAQERSPMASLAAETTSSLISPFNKVLSISKIPGLNSKMVGYANDGVSALVSGFGHGEGNTQSHLESIKDEIFNTILGNILIEGGSKGLSKTKIPSHFTGKQKDIFNDIIKTFPSIIRDDRMRM